MSPPTSAEFFDHVTSHLNATSCYRLRHLCGRSRWYNEFTPSRKGSQFTRKLLSKGCSVVTIYCNDTEPRLTHGCKRSRILPLAPTRSQGLGIGEIKMKELRNIRNDDTLCCAQQTGMHILVVEALLIAIYSTGDEQILIHIRKPCRSRTCLVRIAGPCPAVPVQLVPAQLGLSPAGPYQLWCTSLRIATDTRPTRNKTSIMLIRRKLSLIRSG